MSPQRLVWKAVFAGTVLFAAPVLAEPLQKERIPAAAKWAVHADVEGFLASKTGTFVLAELRKRGLEKTLRNVREMFFFDPTKDLRSVTLFGSGFAAEHRLVVIRAPLDQDRITELLKGNQTYREMKYGGHTIHQWTDDPQGAMNFASFHGKDLAVIGRSVQGIQQALDVLDGKADSLAAPGAPQRLPSAHKGAFLWAYLTELPPMGKGRPEAVLFSKIASAALAAGESEDKLHVELALAAKTARTAENLRRIGDGFLGLLDLIAPQEGGDAPVVLGETPVPAELLAVLAHVQVTAKGRTAKVDASVPVDDVTALLRWLMAHDERRRGEAARAEKRKALEAQRKALEARKATEK